MHSLGVVSLVDVASWPKYAYISTGQNRSNQSKAGMYLEDT
ncbi:Protein of unknown function [Pyronema omphalodes CBS 100304]|uniref:Uncharacterized protein n=1 Tax=Pyronema omphalodes (strain CBS 100304) TaxID=1076935 RepID=U4L6Q8_PYROM|nr:Protein of unknown function [Pyronema omphalodes CBS 100304]